MWRTVRRRGGSMSVVNATPVDWSVVIFILVAAAGVVARWVIPAFMSLGKGGGGSGGSGGTNGHGADAATQRTRIEQMLLAHEPMFEKMVAQQERIATEQGRIADVLDNTHKTVRLIEERSRGQDEAIRTIIDEKRLRDAVEVRLREMREAGLLPKRIPSRKRHP
jgi:hypothetical protein